MTTSESTFFLIVLSLAPLLTSWSCGYANVKEVIAGSSLVLARDATNRDRLQDGTLQRRTSRIASRLKTDFGARILLFGKKSTKLRCLKKLSAPPRLCELCYRAFPKLRQVIQQSS